MSKKTITISLISLLLVGSIASLIVINLLNKSQPVTPETAQTVSELASFLDDETRDTLKTNLTSYTGSHIEEFAVNDDSYQKSDDGIKFQVYNTVDQSLYNIQTVPSPDGDYNHVYVYCAPTSEQLPGITCKLDLDHV